MTQYSGKIIRKNPVVPTQQSASGVWTVTDAAAATRTNTWPVAGVPDPISRSVRLRSSATAYFSKTFTSVGNQQTATWSGWVKRGVLGSTDQTLFAAWTDVNNYFVGYFASTNTLRFVAVSGGSAVMNATTSALFRDPSAWYHIVFKLDTTNATAANRAQIWVNGVLQTVSGTNPSLNANLLSYTTRGMGYDVGGDYVDGYLAEINFVDGQALNPTSFGTTDAFTGAWIPMAYTGTYGANGFYLNFKDNTSTTTLGYDYSGNANNWTTNNISLTSGITYDSMLDVPTPWVGYSATTDTTAVTRGNYAVLNPVNTTATLTSGNLNVASVSASIYATQQVTSGKWYWEITLNGTTSYNYTMGVSNSTGSAYAYMGMCNGGNSPNIFSVATSTNGTVTQPTGSRPSQPATIGIKLDIDAGSIEFYINGTLNGSVTGITNWPSGDFWTPYLSQYTGTFTYQAVVANFGQRPFSQSVPSGHKTLCTTNLPAATINNGAQYMAATTFSANNSTQVLTNGGNNPIGTTFQPDLVWAKSRSNAYSHELWDSIRGVNNILYSNATTAETATANSLTSFNSNGFTLGAASNANYGSGNSVAWQWKAAGSSVSNTSGTITSTVNAGATQGFSVVTYTGTGANATVGHGLGVAPKMMIYKRRSSGADNWVVYHSSIANSQNGGIYLNLTNVWNSDSTLWNNTAPTSSVFTVGTYGSASSVTMVAYCWAEVAGYSKFGSYTGNASTDGPFIYCGFRPRYILIKGSTIASSWYAFDTSRSTYNEDIIALNPDSALSEASALTTYGIDILSNGFKIKQPTGYGLNNSGQTYIYMAVAENPFKFSNAR